MCARICSITCGDSYSEASRSITPPVLLDRSSRISLTHAQSWSSSRGTCSARSVAIRLAIGRSVAAATARTSSSSSRRPSRATSSTSVSMSVPGAPGAPPAGVAPSMSLRIATSYLSPSRPACRTSQTEPRRIPLISAAIVGSARSESCRIMSSSTQCVARTRSSLMCGSSCASVCDAVSRTGATTWSNTKSPSRSSANTQSSRTARSSHHAWCAASFALPPPTRFPPPAPCVRNSSRNPSAAPCRDSHVGLNSSTLSSSASGRKGHSPGGACSDACAAAAMPDASAAEAPAVGAAGASASPSCFTPAAAPLPAAAALDDLSTAALAGPRLALLILPSLLRLRLSWFRSRALSWRPPISSSSAAAGDGEGFAGDGVETGDGSAFLGAGAPPCSSESMSTPISMSAPANPRPSLPMRSFFARCSRSLLSSSGTSYSLPAEASSFVPVARMLTREKSANESRSCAGALASAGASAAHASGSAFTAGAGASGSAFGRAAAPPPASATSGSQTPAAWHT